VNKQDCEQLVEAYVSWLRKGISSDKLEEACELTTPFLDRHNDHLQIYAVKHDGKIVLSRMMDMFYTICGPADWI